MAKVAPAVAILLAACGSEKAVAIQISTTDSSIATVELFVANTHCGDCEGIAPPGVMSTSPRPAGRVDYTIEGNRFSAPVTDGIAGFTLEPSEVGATIDRLAAVGFSGDGSGTAFVLDDTGFSMDAEKGTIRRYALVMHPIETAQPPEATPGFAPKNGDDDDPTTHVVVWRSPTALATTSSCFAIERADGDNEFLVPPDDPDCDGVPVAEECDPDWYDYASPVSPSDPVACLVETTACFVGTDSGQCVDGQTGGCMTTGQNCFPEKACSNNACSQFDGAQCIASLVDESTANVPTSVATLRCTVTYDPNNQDAICSGGTTAIQAPFAHHCAAQFATFTNVYPGFVVSPTLAFDTMTFSGTLQTTSVETTPCAITIGTTGFVTKGGAPKFAVGRGAFALLAGANTLVMPVILDFRAGNCTASSQLFTCVFDNSTGSAPDSIYSCAQ